MTIKQEGLTLIIPIVGNSKRLAKHLKAIDPQIVFGNLTQLHFLSMTVLPPSENSTNSQLMIELNIDGPRSSFIQNLWRIKQREIHTLLKLCRINIPASDSALERLINKYDKGSGTYFKALRGTDLGMIKKSELLRQQAVKYFATSANAFVYPRDLCETMASDLGIQQLLQTLPTRWPGEGLQKAWVLTKILFSFLFFSILMISGGAGIANQEIGDLNTVATHIGFLLASIAFIMSLIFRSAEHSRASEISNFLLLGISLISSMIVFLSGYLAWVSGTHVGLIIEVVLLLGSLITFVYLLLRIGTTAPLHHYLSRIIHFAIFLFLLLYILSNNLILNSVPGVTAGQIEAIALASAIISFGFLTIFIIVYCASRFYSTRRLSVLLGPGLAFSLIISLPSYYLEGLQPLATLAIAFLAFIGYVAVISLCKIEEREHADFESAPFWKPSALRRAITLQETSNPVEQQHLISYTEIKPGALRLVALRIILSLVGMLNTLEGKRSELSGIATIHFARWLIIDNSRLLFLTNYSGTWDSYLDEFIDQSSRGLTAIWSNTAGFPRSRWLSAGGAQLEQRFKMYARNSQLESLCHYRAYPQLSVNQIEDNLRLNSILSDKNRTDAECESVLRML